MWDKNSILSGRRNFNWENKGSTTTKMNITSNKNKNSSNMQKYIFIQFFLLFLCNYLPTHPSATSHHQHIHFWGYIQLYCNLIWKFWNIKCKEMNIINPHVSCHPVSTIIDILLLSTHPLHIFVNESILKAITGIMSFHLYILQYSLLRSNYHANVTSNRNKSNSLKWSNIQISLILQDIL